MESFTIPAKVTKLGLYAFDGCDNLSEVTCLTETPPSVGFSFLVRDHNNLTKEILIYVPENSIKNYDEKWNRLTFDRYYYFIPIGNKAKFITMANGDKYIINETTEKATLRYPAFSEAKQIPFHHPFTLEGKHILSQRLHPVVSKMHLSKLLSYLPQSKQSVLKLSGAKI